MKIKNGDKNGDKIELYNNGFHNFFCRIQKENIFVCMHVLYFEWICRHDNIFSGYSV